MVICRDKVCMGSDVWNGRQNMGGWRPMRGGASQSLHERDRWNE